MATSSIEWTECTWNPVTGCTKVSPGCKYCYAERLALRLRAMGLAKYAHGFEVALHPDALLAPVRWKRPRLVFVNSMSDLFHDDVPDPFVDEVFGVMALCPQHTFQVLTKRPLRARAYLQRRTGDTLAVDRDPGPWGPLSETRHPLPNVWLGTSVESADYLHRADALRTTPAKVRFLSLEPLLGPLTGLDLAGIDWVIAGGESGPHARPLDPDWARGIRDTCVAADVPFFFKQWGGTNKKRTGRVLDGRTWDELPRSPAERQRAMEEHPGVAPALAPLRPHPKKYAMAPSTPSTNTRPAANPTPTP